MRRSGFRPPRPSHEVEAAHGATIQLDGHRSLLRMKEGARARRALVVGADLMARGRLEQPLAAAGFALAATSAERLEEALRAEEPGLVILDLDSGGRELLDRLVEARERGAVPKRVVGYFSHVDAELGAAARAAGCEALPRGRFWRSLPEVLAGV